VPEATFRFYEELNDFLPRERRKCQFSYRFRGDPSVKAVVEAIGVPHTEIDVILVDGRSVGFDELLSGGERVSVYPVFERLDVSPVIRLRARPLRRTRFVVDVHLERLGRYLRMVGIDTLSPADSEDAAIVESSLIEGRIVLTRDRGLLQRARLQRARWIRSQKPREQLVEVIRCFQLEDGLAFFSRCLVCNTPLESVSSTAVGQRVPASVRVSQESFTGCPGCGRIYWQGTHYRRMRQLLDQLGLPGEPVR
jgi:uncharacterized protein with PIN domain